MRDTQRCRKRGELGTRKQYRYDFRNKYEVMKQILSKEKDLGYISSYETKIRLWFI